MKQHSDILEAFTLYEPGEVNNYKKCIEFISRVILSTLGIVVLLTLLKRKRR